jgi:hypothetical protein
MAIKSIITVANKLSSVITENSIVAKSIRKNDDIVKKSIIIEVDTIFLKTYSRFFTDSINLNDDSVKQVDKQLFDSANIQDLFSTISKYNRVFDDIFSSSDFVALNLQKDIFDSVSITDDIVYFITGRPERIELDIILADDLSSINFDKLVSDTFDVLDNINNKITKNLSDSINLDSVGSLFSQGYTVDNTYFLEEYVGESRTFT